MISLQDWLTFLKDSRGAAGLPLVLAGLALMLFGWRMWRICVVLAYGFIGAVLGGMLAGPGQNDWFWAITGGLLLGAFSYWPVQHSITVLGGLIGGACIMWALSQLRLEGTALWLAGAVAFVGCTAFAALNRQRVVISVTAFLGAACLISGISAWIMPWPAMWATVMNVVAESVIVVPFILLVPTVMSWFYQVSEMRRLQIEL
jgi:hypothetical protein